MAHPWPVLLGVVFFLVSLGLPVLHLGLGQSGAASLPPRMSARQGYEILKEDFGEGELSPILVVVTSPTRP